jgi:PhnB protein
MSQLRVRPKLVIGGPGADAAITFYEQVLGARPVVRHTMGDSVVFAQLELPSGDVLQVKDADQHDPAPRPDGGGVVLDVECDDPDAVAAAAVERGARMVFEVADQPYGSRQGRFCDPFGHQWIVGTSLTMGEAEVQAALEKWAAHG